MPMLNIIFININHNIDGYSNVYAEIFENLFILFYHSLLDTQIFRNIFSKSSASATVVDIKKCRIESPFFKLEEWVNQVLTDF